MVHFFKSLEFGSTHGLKTFSNVSFRFSKIFEFFRPKMTEIVLVLLIFGAKIQIDF